MNPEQYIVNQVTKGLPVCHPIMDSAYDRIVKQYRQGAYASLDRMIIDQRKILAVEIALRNGTTASGLADIMGCCVATARGLLTEKVQNGGACVDRTARPYIYKEVPDGAEI